MSDIELEEELNGLGAAREVDKHAAAQKDFGGDKTPEQENGIVRWMKNLPANVSVGLMDAAINMYDFVDELDETETTPHEKRMRTSDAVSPARALEVAGQNLEAGNNAGDPVRDSVFALRNFMALGTGGAADTITQGVSQFAIPFMGWSKAFQGLKAAATAPKLAQTAGKVGQAVAAEAATMATAFDSHAGRLADLVMFGKHTEGKFADALNAVAPDGSAINAYIEYMSSREDESDAEGRFKNVVDGLVGSAAVAGLLKTGATTFRAARAFAESPIKLPEVGAPTHLVEGADMVLPARKLPRANYSTDLSTYAPTLYRETGLDKLDQFTGGTRLDMSLDDLHFADTPEMALGQGNNKGVLLEFESAGIKGQINLSKPGLAHSFESGMGEYVGRLNHQPAYEKALRAVTIKPDVIADKVTKMRTKRVLADLESKGWTKTTAEDGAIKYTRPSAETAAIAQDALAQFPDSPYAAMMHLTEQADNALDDDLARGPFAAAADNVRAKLPETGVTIVPGPEGHTIVVGKQPLVTFLDEKDAIEAVADYRRQFGAAFEKRAAQEHAKASDKDFATLHSFSRVLAANKDRPVSTHSMLSALERNLKGDTEQGAFYKELLSRLARKKLGGTTTVSSKAGRTVDVAGHYATAFNAIELYDRAFRDPKSLLHTFTHEAVHAATMNEMNASAGVLRKIDALRKAAFEVPRKQQEAVGKALSQFGKEGATVEKPVRAEDAIPNISGSEYGFTNAYEFVAEIESNPEFRKLMQKTKLEDGGTAWDKYLETIAGILGVTGLLATPAGQKEFSKLMMGPKQEEKPSG